MSANQQMLLGTGPSGWTQQADFTTKMGSSDAKYSVVIGSTIYIACSYPVAVLKSTDGITWTSSTSSIQAIIPGATSSVYGLAVKGTTLCLLGWSITNTTARTATSTDGVTWTGDSGTASLQIALTAAGNASTGALGATTTNFVVGGNAAFTSFSWYSANGTTGWTLGGMGNKAGTYPLGMSSNGTGVMCVGTDASYSAVGAATWSTGNGTLPTATLSNQLYDVVWTGTVWFAVSYYYAASSTDGVTWTRQTGWSNVLGTASVIPRVWWVNGTLWGTSAYKVAYSTDQGVTWTLDSDLPVQTSDLYSGMEKIGSTLIIYTNTKCWTKAV